MFLISSSNLDFPTPASPTNPITWPDPDWALSKVSKRAEVVTLYLREGALQIYPDPH